LVRTEWRERSKEWTVESGKGRWWEYSGKALCKNGMGGFRKEEKGVWREKNGNGVTKKFSEKVVTKEYSVRHLKRGTPIH